MSVLSMKYPSALTWRKTVTVVSYFESCVQARWRDVHVPTHSYTSGLHVTMPNALSYTKWPTPEVRLFSSKTTEESLEQIS